MRSGYPATAIMAVLIALIAKNLAIPLLMIASFGLVDRLITNIRKDKSDQQFAVARSRQGSH